MDHCDIVFIHAGPAAAVIYYYTQLFQSHCLYSPHSIQVPVRELGRNLLHILDSQDTKKLAVHFPTPLGAAQMNGLISFLRSRRTTIHLALLSLTVTPYQQHLWAGWAASLIKRADKDATLRSWVDRCSNDREFGPLSVETSLFDYHETSPPTTQRESIICISRYQFKKKALLIHITPNLSAFTLDQGLVLDQNVCNMIQAYVETEAFPQLILLGDEKVIFGKIPNYTTLSEDEQQQAIQQRREQIKLSLQRLASEIPMYLCCRDYTEVVDSRFKSSLTRMLAWVQHRHQLALSRCILAEWAPETLEDCTPAYVQDMHRISLRDSSYFRLNKWKVEMEKWLSKIDKQPKYDKMTCIPPESLKISGSLPSFEIPLLEERPYELVNIEEFGNSIVHGLFCATTETLEAWSTKAKQDDEDMMDIQMQSPEESTLIRSNDDLRVTVANRMTNESIQHYIGNIGAFKRGEDLISTVSSVNMNVEDDRLLLSGRAKGTSQEPYSLRITLKASATDLIYENGFCSCYVGKEGRCKHIVGLLLWYKNESAKLSQRTLPFSQGPSKSGTIETSSVTSDAEKDVAMLESTPTSIVSPTAIENQALPHPSPPMRRRVPRVLPPSSSQQVEEKKKSTSRKRKHESTVSDAAPKEETEAQTSNGQGTSRRAVSKGKGRAPVTSRVESKAKASNNPASSRVPSVLNSDSDIDEDDVLRYAPATPKLDMSPKLQPLHLDTKQEVADEPVATTSISKPPPNTPKPLPNFPRSPIKRLASLEDDGTDDEAEVTSKSTTANDSIDMKRSLFQAPSERSSTPDEKAQGLDRPKKKKRLQSMLDDLLSL
ncbi:hypothetical protein K450DRAFT_256388 [Umbelopsis ramanniana AG]|uniref:SWIM-type domain-containing protein n=1 Tax=Umbelopsis ramanniana AG TaxID=1314678 RepID=A0AAD5HA77_UMBRA|nr:uncharacterized protein K450DRAFT_256388 [Umbelopsis ramanniana AG]KAI8576602.1 hypothetical protein K450DRAFT_256388 [Umbelopsis ramanniana AG]